MTPVKAIVCSLIFFLSSSCAQIGSNGNSTPSPLLSGTCQEGETRTGFLRPTSTGDQPCPTGTKTCINGQWTGPQVFESCESSTKSCDGVAHGMIQNGYLHPTTTQGVPCPQGTRTCINGTWAGPPLFESCQEI